MNERVEALLRALCENIEYDATHGWPHSKSVEKVLGEARAALAEPLSTEPASDYLAIFEEIGSYLRHRADCSILEARSETAWPHCSCGMLGAENRLLAALSVSQGAPHDNSLDPYAARMRDALRDLVATTWDFLEDCADRDALTAAVVRARGRLEA